MIRSYDNVALVVASKNQNPREGIETGEWVELPGEWWRFELQKTKIPARGLKLCLLQVLPPQLRFRLQKTKIPARGLKLCQGVFCEIFTHLSTFKKPKSPRGD